MGRRRKEQRLKARRASTKAKTNGPKRRPLSAYPIVNGAYDMSQMLAETGVLSAGRLLVTARLWDDIIRSAPNHTEADWRLYDVAHWIKMFCVGDEQIEFTLKRLATEGNWRWHRPPVAISNRTMEFWLEIGDERGVAADVRLKLVDLADGQGNWDMIVMMGNEDESTVLAKRSLLPDDDIHRIGLILNGFYRRCGCNPLGSGVDCDRFGAGPKVATYGGDRS